MVIQLPAHNVISIRCGKVPHVQRGQLVAIAEGDGQAIDSRILASCISHESAESQAIRLKTPHVSTAAPREGGKVSDAGPNVPKDRLGVRKLKDEVS